MSGTEKIEQKAGFSTVKVCLRLFSRPMLRAKMQGTCEDGLDGAL